VLNFDDDPNLADLQREWRAEETLMQPGVLSSRLLFCGTVTESFANSLVAQANSRTKNIKQVDSLYLSSARQSSGDQTPSHTQITEYLRGLRIMILPQTITRVNGNAIVMASIYHRWSSLAHPIINFGDRQIELDTTHPDLATVYPSGIIPAGVGVEISSYPWERRVVDSNGISLASYIVTDRPYLDTIRFPYNSPTVISWTGTSLGAGSNMRFMWHDAYQVMD
jgi:hypothetical protein